MEWCKGSKMLEIHAYRRKKRTRCVDEPMHSFLGKNAKNFFSRFAFHILHFPRNDAKRESSFSLLTYQVSLRNAFTLAEVLITLGIIGVVAAMTIPVLMQSLETSQYKVAYKKAYNSLTNALMSANASNELISASTTADFDINFLTIMSKFKIIKQCISGSDNASCWDSTGEKYGLSFSAGYPNASRYAFIDSSGMSWSRCLSTSSIIIVDTNGFKQPNQWGKDRFVFWLYDVDNAADGIPVKVKPFSDNHTNICTNNKCGTVGDPDYQTYYGASWILGK